MRPRDVFAWKFPFYSGLLPALRALGPDRADALLASIGRASLSVWPGRRRMLVNALARARLALGRFETPWDDQALAPELAVGLVRSLARDYLFENDPKSQTLFDVEGDDALRGALARGRGAVLVGSHLGAHLAAFHWLDRNRLPCRLMVQRPKHVTSTLNRFFDRDDPGAPPQSGFFLRRGLGKADCVERLLNARSALRAGKALYLAGDIPWTGPNTRAGRLLGQSHRFLSVWADLAALNRAPVFFAFASHRDGGRVALTFEPVGDVAPGDEFAVVSRFLARLESRIAADPADAPAHLLWPCFGPARSSPGAMTANPRPSRRVTAVGPG